MPGQPWKAGLRPCSRERNEKLLKSMHGKTGAGRRPMVLVHSSMALSVHLRPDATVRHLIDLQYRVLTNPETFWDALSLDGSPFDRRCHELTLYRRRSFLSSLSLPHAPRTPSFSLSSDWRLLGEEEDRAASWLCTQL